MSKNNFTRTNVNVQDMEVSAPNRSSFDLSINAMCSVPFGKLFPVRVSKLIPGDTIKGSVNPQLQLENFVTPAAGRMRLDTHSFVVSARRIHNQYRQFMESATSATPGALPSFTLVGAVNCVLPFYFWNGFGSGTSNPVTLSAFKTAYPSPFTSVVDPTIFLQRVFGYTQNNLKLHSSNANLVGFKQDWLAIECEKIKGLNTSVSTLSTFYLGDFMYRLFESLLGEGSVMDMLGYDIISKYSEIVDRLNKADIKARAAIKGTGNWDATKLASWLTALEANCVNIGEFLKIDDYSTDDSEFTVSSDLNPKMSEMPLRANYAVWYDYFRNWHLEPNTGVINPDNFSTSPFIGTTPTQSNATTALQLLAQRPRNWSRDGFTMVQPDDVYRHVYAPAPESTGDATGYLVYNDSAYDNFFTSVSGSLMDDTIFSSYFPSQTFGSMTSFFGSPDSLNVLYHDLQTMRRAGMLEKYLARNYFNPDTYVGYIEARYGVKPVDFSILTCQALGGNSTMINGEQITSATGTEDNSGNVVTYAGQRTLKADASSNDSFSYNTTDPAYLLSYVSIMPLVHYDARNPHLHELSPQEQVIPEYANDNRIIIRTCDLMRNYNDKQNTMLGYVPRYYGYRTALDTVHGKYLSDYRLYTWLRDRYMYNTAANDNINIAMTQKDALSEHVYLPLDCFLGLKPWDTIAFGSIDLPLFVERALPAKVEFI